MKLRIAEVAPLWFDNPPKKYGGTERIVYNLTEGMVKAGHNVTFFASGTSKTSAELVSIYPHALIEDNIPWTNIMYPLLNITEAFDREKEFDIIHINLNVDSDVLALPLAKSLKNKVVFTVHFPAVGINGIAGMQRVIEKYKDLNFISISQAQRKGFEKLNWIGTVYNGIDLSSLHFHPHPQDYFVWIGKFKYEKGTKEAVLAAKKAGVKLILGGAVDTFEPACLAYYEDEIKPLIDNKQIIYVGEVDEQQKNELFGNATAFLNPIQWNEPFGLVMAESLATGTPVISFDNGAAPEIIVDGKTGYIVNSVDEMVEKMTQVQNLSRKECRDRVVTHFSSEIMTGNYISVFEDLMNKNAEPASNTFDRSQIPSDVNIEQYYHQQIFLKHNLKNKIKL